ncbi:MAG: electron transporter SenC [Chloroflexota bacterium]|nr:SCO family protein [Chloroflexota bacterium]NOG64311.1 redoxin domain-containing protein [Chloroflexota bacterium]GIK66932.1 MAG: electron transporter SenC [Chloroflexota bacterium]
MNYSPRLLWLLAALLVVLAACGGKVESNKNESNPAPGEGDLLGVLTEPRQLIENFGGPSTQDTDFNLDDYRGKVVLIYFGFTTCPDICPTTLAEIRQVMSDLGEDAANVQFVMVTIDPERDTLDKLKAYVETFNTSFIGLRQEGETLQAMQDTFEVKAFKQELPDSAMGYTFDHTPSVFVIDKQGRWVERFLFGTSPSTIERDVRLLLAEN